MPWNVLPDLNASTYVVAAHMDQLRENIEWLGALRVGNSTLANLAAAYMVGGLGFCAYDTSNQAINSTLVKITFTLERFDTNSAYDTSTSRFTAPAAGLYQIGARLRTTGAAYIEIRKNGTAVAVYGDSGDNWLNGELVSLLSLAASDYIEIFAASTGACTVTKTATISEFWGAKVG